MEDSDNRDLDRAFGKILENAPPWHSLTDEQAEKIIATLKQKMQDNPQENFRRLRNLYESIAIYSTDTTAIEILLPMNATKDDINTMSNRLKRIQNEISVLLIAHKSLQGNSQDRT